MRCGDATAARGWDARGDWAQLTKQRTFRTAVLRWRDANGAHEITIDEAVTVGSSERCGIVIDGDGISRMHLELDPTDGGVVIRDLASTNGTFAGGSATRPRSPTRDCESAASRSTSTSRTSHSSKTIDCTGFPPHLLESELFGHARGAFTGDETSLLHRPFRGTVARPQRAGTSRDERKPRLSRSTRTHHRTEYPMNRSILVPAIVLSLLPACGGSSSSSSSSSSAAPTSRQQASSGGSSSANPCNPTGDSQLGRDVGDGNGGAGGGGGSAGGSTQ